MLRRRSIRTKLIVALTLLSAIVLLLAVSGFWGLYGYRQTTDAILLRSRQQLEARRLCETADDLMDSNERLLDLIREEGLIDLTFAEKIRFEKSTFAFAMDTFADTLGFYPHQETYGVGPDSEVADAISEEASFTQIRMAFAPLQQFANEPSSDVWHARAGIREPLENLIEKSSDHSAVISADVQRLTRSLGTHHNTWRTVAWICTALAVSMVAILLWSFNSLVVKPFRTLLDGSRLVAGGQFDHRIDLGTGDELSELAVAMNEMTDRFQGALNKVNSWCTDLDQQVRDRTREVIQNEQLASVGFLAAGVAHEINNPLAAIAWSAESLESRVGEIAQKPEGEQTIDAELSQCLTENLRRIEEEAFRCKGITEKLLDFSRLKEVRRAPTNLVDLVNDVVSMVGKVGKYRCKRIEVRGRDEVIAHVNPQEIRQVVLNLVTNAMESLGPEGGVEIDIDTDGVTASIAIADNGCGMTDEVLKHIFEPFFTRRQDGTGTGLGLSITYRIVSQHGGSLTAQSDGQGRGSKMEILLPVSPAQDDSPQRRNNLGLTHEPQKST